MTPEMDQTDLHLLAGELLVQARDATSGRATRAIPGGPARQLTHLVLALTAGNGLSEHENPGEATLLGLKGRLRLSAGELSQEFGAGEMVVIPRSRHALAALQDSAVVLTFTRTASR